MDTFGVKVARYQANGYSRPDLHWFVDLLYTWMAFGLMNGLEREKIIVGSPWTTQQQLSTIGHQITLYETDPFSTVIAWWAFPFYFILYIDNDSLDAVMQHANAPPLDRGTSLPYTYSRLGMLWVTMLAYSHR